MMSGSDNEGEILLSEKDDRESNSRPNTVQGAGYQILATVVANLLAITDGMTMGWTSPMIPYFLSPKSHIEMTEKQAEWIETSVLIGVVCGLPITAMLINKIGRRKSLMISCLVLIVCWVLIAVANRVSLIYLARMGKGLGLNMAFTSLPMFVGEISHKKIRGLLTASTYIFMLIGIVIIYSIGPYVPYMVAPMLASAILVIELILFLFIPESPYQLLMQGKQTEAEFALFWFRGGADINDEMLELRTAMEESRNETMKLMDLIRFPNNRRAMVILCVINFAQLFGSFELILMNLHEILENAGSIYIESSLAAIIFSVIMLTFAIISSLFVDKFGRKILIIISTLLTAVCILILAIYFNLKALDYNVKNVSWIPIVCVMSYAACFKFGLGTVPIVLTAEIISQNVKTICLVIADGAYVACSIASLQIYFYLKDSYGMHAPFYIFSGCLFTVLPYFIFILPETKGKSLIEIQDMLREQKCF